MPRGNGAYDNLANGESLSSAWTMLLMLMLLLSSPLLSSALALLLLSLFLPHLVEKKW